MLIQECDGDGFGRRIVRNSAEFAAGALLHEDARYRGLYQGSYVRRLRHATIRAFQASVPGGGYRPAYSRFAAIAVGELVAPVWCTAGAPGPRVLPSNRLWDPWTGRKQLLERVHAGAHQVRTQGGEQATSRRDRRRGAAGPVISILASPAAVDNGGVRLRESTIPAGHEGRVSVLPQLGQDSVLEPRTVVRKT